MNLKLVSILILMLTVNIFTVEKTNAQIIEVFTISQPPLLEDSASTTNVTCNAGLDGAFNLIVSGGTTTYTYSWIGPNAFTSTIASAGGLVAGTYNVTVWDSEACSLLDSLVITEPSIITGMDSLSICSGDSILLGGAYQTTAGAYFDTLIATNGCDSAVMTILTIYSTYLIADPSDNTCLGDSVLIYGLFQSQAGTYYDSLSSVDGCDSVHSTILTLTVGPSITILAQNDSICSGDSVGIVASPAAYTNYEFFVGGVSIQNGPSNIFVTTAITSTDTITAVAEDLGCPGPLSNVEIITVIVFTGSGNYSICAGDSVMLGGSYQTTAGMYVDTLASSVGCDSVVTTTLTVTSLNLTLSAAQDAGSCNGSATVTVSGGAPPYTYLWNDPGSQSTATATGLCGNNYNVTVSDAQGCNSSDTILVGSAVCTFSVSVTSNNASCGNSNGFALATVTGGVLPYTYSWSSGDTLANSDSLPAGVYIVNIWDVSGCNTIGVATISDAGGPVVGVGSITDVSCNGGNDGAIDINVAGGPVVYAWSSGDITEDLTGLEAGAYDLQVTGMLTGCVSTINVIVSAPSALTIISSVANATCGNSDGSITANVIGGTSPFTYNWSNGATSSSISNLIWGAYSVTITDANTCIDSASSGLSETGSATIVVDSIIPAPCSGNGAIFISNSGGSSPFTYMWSNSVSTEDNLGIGAGIYDVTLTDSSGCMSVSSIEVTAELLSIQQICLVSVDSLLFVNEVVWEKPASTSIDYYNIYKESTTAGVYFLAGTVDYDSLSTFVDPNSNPNQRSWRYKITVVDFCGNESGFSDIHKTMHVSISPGLGNDYNLAWNDYQGFAYGTYFIHRYRPSEGWVLRDSLPSNLSTWTDFSVPQGQVNYVVEAKHPSGCIATKQKNFNSAKSNTSSVLVLGSLLSTTSSVDASFGNCDGSASITASGGTPPYTYLWDDSLAQTSATAIGLCPGMYTVIVVDADANTIIDTSMVGEALGAAPVVDYMGDITVIFEGDSVNFTDLSTNAPTTWFWVFTGGTPGTSSIENPVDISYANVGSYDVSLIATNSFGSDTLVKSSYIVVDPKVGIGEIGVGYRNVKVSPNPFAESSLLSFENKSRERLELSIFNGLGERVRVYENIIGNEVVIAKDDFAPGTYYYRLNGESGQDIGVIVVQ